MKKTKQIGIRITEDCYNLLESYARERKWSMAFSASEILEGYLKEKGALAPPSELQSLLRDNSSGHVS